MQNQLHLNYRFIKLYIFRYKFLFLLNLLLAISGVLLKVAQPILWGRMLENLFTQNFANILSNIAIFSGTCIITFFIEYNQNLLSTKLNESIVCDVREEVFSKIVKLKMSYFRDEQEGELINILNQDIQNISSFFTGNIYKILIDLLQAIVIAIISISLNWKLATIILIAFPISLGIMRYFERKTDKQNATVFKENDNYLTFLNQQIHFMREVKTLGLKTQSCHKHSSISNNLKRMNMNLYKTHFQGAVIANGAIFVFQMLIFIIGSYMVVYNGLLLRYFVAFSQYTSQFIDSLMNLTSVNAQLQKSKLSLKRIVDLLMTDRFEEEQFGDITLEYCQGRICFSDLSYTYPDSKFELNQLNLEIESGSKVGIIGNSGSGKSTMFSLLTGMLDYCTGDIEIDGVSLRALSEDSIRKHITIVPQRPVFFSESILNNLKMVNTLISDDEIIEWCKLVQMHDKILSLAEGYNTIICNNMGLSEGEIQRLAIARALVRKSKIILLDEATSALDTELQQDITDVINKLRGERTFVVIAHRLQTIIDSDKIIVMSDGKIINIGKHDDLLSQSTFYKRNIEAHSIA